MKNILSFIIIFGIALGLHATDDIRQLSDNDLTQRCFLAVQNTDHETLDVCIAERNRRHMGGAGRNPQVNMNLAQDLMRAASEAGIEDERLMQRLQNWNDVMNAYLVSDQTRHMRRDDFPLGFGYNIE